MRKIAIAAAVSLSLSGVANVSHALGLGEIEMYSALNQTLDAEIAILSATEAELRDMNVRLASQSAFARAGLVQSPVLSSVDFSVNRRPDGKAVVKVTSDSPVLEPFLNFLIEVNAPGSVKLVREYTVLLNPTTIAGQTHNRSGSVPLPIPNGSSGVFASGSSSSNGVQIDLADAMNGGITNNGGDTRGGEAGQVVFTESSRGTAGGGQEILLTQDIVNSPQYGGRSVSGGEAIPLDGQGVSFDSLNTDNGNAMFTSEFERGQGERISTDELRGLINNPESTVGLVEFQESTAEDVFVSNFSNDTDAQGGAGDLIDLSGLLDDSSSVFVENPSINNTVTDIELSGNTYRIRRQDTLWSIATAQKAPGVTTHQMVVALVDANPRAFIGGNMNRMISGAVLQIPTQGSQRSVGRSSAVEMVKAWTNGNTPPARTNRSVNIIQPSTVYEEVDTGGDYGNATFTTDVNSNLDDVNQRYETIQSEIATETAARDDLQGRVDNLTTNMEQMKSLITVRESELDQLQDEVQAAESNAAAIDAQISQLSDASNNVAVAQQGLSKELQQARDAISMQADADKNLATAQAQAQSVRLSSEEDALRAQLAALELEKRNLEGQSELEKANLVRQAEAEKTRLLAQATAERERILAELEAKKARINNEAELNIARVTNEAQTNPDFGKTDTSQLQVQSPQMDSETPTTAQSTEPERVKDRLALLQEEGAENVADVQASIANAANTDTTKLDVDANTDSGATVSDTLSDTVSGISDAGKSLAAGGAAAVGGLSGIAPLQMTIGNRKTVLAAGAGLSLLGLLGAWAVRRRKTTHLEHNGFRPRGAGRPVVKSQAQPDANYNREEAIYSDSDDYYAKPQRRPSSSAAAAAAAAAAAVTGTAVATNSRGNESTEQENPVAFRGNEPTAPEPVAPEPVAREPGSHEQAQTTTHYAAPEPAIEAPSAAPPATTAPAPHATTNQATTNQVPPPPVQQSAEMKPTHSEIDTTASVAGAPTAGSSNNTQTELEEKALDDTITEAEVYLRYGLHGQAEDLLKTAIERSPNNEEYHFKLLENYHDQKNADGFNSWAGSFDRKFPNSGHKARIAEMGSEITGGYTGPASNTDDHYPAASEVTSGEPAEGNGRVGFGGALAAGAAGAAAMATGAVANAKDSATDGFNSLTGSHNETDHDLLDQTIDPGTEFSVDELQATGNLGAYTHEHDNVQKQGGLDQGGLNHGGSNHGSSNHGSLDHGGMSLDDVDLASLDDDGTMNLEEIAGSRMSGADLGRLDLTNPVDNAYDNLSLEDTNSGDIHGGVAGIAGGIGQGLDTDLPIGNPVAGGTDEMETMLDLAKAYIDMGDSENASKALKDITARGNPLQQAEAAELLNKLT